MQLRANSCWVGPTRDSAKKITVLTTAVGRGGQKKRQVWDATWSVHHCPDTCRGLAACTQLLWDTVDLCELNAVARQGSSNSRPSTLQAPHQHDALHPMQQHQQQQCSSQTATAAGTPPPAAVNRHSIQQQQPRRIYMQQCSVWPKHQSDPAGACATAAASCCQERGSKGADHQTPVGL